MHFKEEKITLRAFNQCLIDDAVSMPSRIHLDINIICTHVYRKARLLALPQISKLSKWNASRGSGSIRRD